MDLSKPIAPLCEPDIRSINHVGPCPAHHCRLGRRYLRGLRTMDFIEKLFGLSPDNGDGSTEILWLAALAIVIAAFVYFTIQRRKAQR